MLPYTLSAFMLRVGLGLFSRLEVAGAEHIPRQGACIVTCNHRSALDPLYLGLATRPRQVRFMAKQELFRVPVARMWLRAVGAYPVNRAAPGPSMLKETLRLLQRGEMVGIFPEGTRHGQQQGMKAGAVRLALKAGVPILPGAYHGPVKLGPAQIWRRPPARVVFGPVISYDRYQAKRPDEGLVQQLVEELSQTMAALAEEAGRWRC